MLCLQIDKVNEGIWLHTGDGERVYLSAYQKHGKLKISVTAPQSVKIYRSSLCDAEGNVKPREKETA